MKLHKTHLAEVQVPKFKIETDLQDLLPVLKKAGMSSLNNFTGIIAKEGTNESLEVTKVVQGSKH